jgi:hypothetical protein
VIVPLVAPDVVGLALANTQAPAPREAYAIASIAFWAVAVIGTLAGVFPRAPLPRAAALAGTLLAGFAAFIALSLSWASDQGRAFDQVALASCYLGLFVLVALAARDGEGRLWLKGLAVGLVGVAILALAPRFLPDVFGSPDESLQAGGRIGYPINYWNGLAAMMAGAVGLLGWLAANARARAERVAAFAVLALPLLVLYMAKSRGGGLATLAALGVLVIAGPARTRLVANLALVGAIFLPLFVFAREQTAFIELPGSAAAADQGPEVLIFAIATIVVAWVFRGRLDRRLTHLEMPRLSRRSTIVVAVAGAVVALLALAAFDPVQRFDDFRQPPTAEQLASDEQASVTTRSGGGRWQYWGTAVDAFADEPLHGIGAGEFAVYWNQHGPFGFSVQNAHSLFLESLAELGLIGFLLITGFLAVVVVAGVVRVSYVRDGAASAALAVLAAGLVSAGFDFVWELPAVFAPVIVVAALLTTNALTPALLNAPPAPPAPPRRSRAGLALAGATLLAGWASMIACGWIVLTERELDRSDAAANSGDYRAAITEAEDAVDLMPWAAAPRVELGLAYQVAGDLTSARRELREGVERADEDWRYWRALALVDLAAGNLGDACREIARTRELNPRQELVYQEVQGLECPGPEPKPPAP